MRRRVPASLAVALLAALAIAVGGRALAYFAGPGSGSASAAVSLLPTPTISSATAASGGTVSLTWGAVSPPGSGAVTYYLTRDGGAPAGSCPTKAAPATLTSCEDSSVPVGEHSYRVVAIWHSWTATGAVRKVKVTIGEATRFAISASTATPATGGAVDLTITAKDANNATVSSYDETHNLVFSGAYSSPNGDAPTVVDSSGTAIAFGAATALSFSNGVASVSGGKNGVLRIYDDGPADVTASEEGIATPTPLALTVSAAATSFALKATTATPAVGAGDDLTVTAGDAYGNTATSYTGPHKLTFSGAGASPAGNVPTVTNTSGSAVAFGSPTTISFSAGVADPAKGAAGTAVLYTVETAAIVASEGSITTPSPLSLTPTPGSASRLALEASTPTPAAASNFNLTTIAEDSYGNTATSYTGTKTITFSGAEASPSGAQPTVSNSSGTAVNIGSGTPLAFSKGIATVSSSRNGRAKLTAAGPTSLSASDGTISTAAPLTLTVAPGTATRVAVAELVNSAGSVGSPCLFTCTVTGLGNSGTIKASATITDAGGNVVEDLGATKSVTVSVSKGGLIVGSPLSIPAIGGALSGSQFTYTAPVSGSFSHTVTIASSGYTSAKITAKK